MLSTFIYFSTLQISLSTILFLTAIISIIYQCIFPQYLSQRFGILTCNFGQHNIGRYCQYPGVSFMLLFVKWSYCNRELVTIVVNTIQQVCPDFNSGGRTWQKVILRSKLSLNLSPHLGTSNWLVLTCQYFTEAVWAGGAFIMGVVS